MNIGKRKLGNGRGIVDHAALCSLGYNFVNLACADILRQRPPSIPECLPLPRANPKSPTPALPAETSQATRFGKTRAAQSHALLEDYVELIADLLASNGEARPTDMARRLGVSHATAIKTIGRLKREGLATSLPYRGVFLTTEGEALAQTTRARHRLVIAVLTAIGVPPEAAEQDAEGIEHHISPATLRAFASFLKKT